MADRMEEKPVSWRAVGALIGPVWRERRRKLLALGAVTVIAALAGYAGPLLQRGFIDALNVRNSAATLWFAAWALAVWALIRGLGGVELYWCNTLQARFGAALKERVLGSLFELPVSFFRRHGSAYLTGRLGTDIEAVNYFFSAGMWQMLRNVLKAFGGVVFLCWLDWRVGAGILVLAPLYGWLTWKFRHRQYRLSSEIYESLAKSQQTIHNSLRNMTLLKSNVSELATRNRIHAELGTVTELKMRRFKLESGFRLLLQVVPACSYLLLFGAGIWLILQQRWSLGELWAMKCYLDFVFGPVQALCTGWLQMNNARAAAGRLISWKELTPESNLDAGIQLTHCDGKIEFQHVTFGYDPAHPVLRELSFTIAPGETVGIAGPSGCGKSTLLNLLLRLYVPQTGVIRLDDRPLDAYCLRSLRRRLGYINQRPEFMNGTLADNLCLGVGVAIPEARLYEVLEQVGLGRVAARQPQGLRTVMYDDAENFSIGERLRLALARELLRDTDILILDEATANLDEKNEQLILTLLKKLFAGKTVLLVSHRAGTLAGADRVITLAAEA